LALNRKRIRRLWRRPDLQTRARKKRRTGPCAGEQRRLTAEYPKQRGRLDFQSDRGE
jgi:hypothetical protein